MHEADNTVSLSICDWFCSLRISNFSIGYPVFGYLENLQIFASVTTIYKYLDPFSVQVNLKETIQVCFQNIFYII